MGDQENIGENLHSYIQGFWDIRPEISSTSTSTPRLTDWKSKLLYQVTEKFAISIYTPKHIARVHLDAEWWSQSRDQQ